MSGPVLTLRQSVIACVKSELQHPYNLGVITREQFMKMCSTVTKDFLARVGPEKTALAPADEAQLRANTTALLTKLIGSGSGMPSPPPEDDRTSAPAFGDAPPALAAHIDLPRRHEAATPSDIPEQTSNSRASRRAFVHDAVDTPGAVLASTDTEVMKYQDHLSRLSQLNTGLPGVKPSLLTPRGRDGGGEPRGSPGVSMTSLPGSPAPAPQRRGGAMPQQPPPTHHVGGGSGATVMVDGSPSRAGTRIAQQHLAAAKQCQAEMLQCMTRMHELYQQMSQHLQAVEEGVNSSASPTPQRGFH